MRLTNAEIAKMNLIAEGSEAKVYEYSDTVVIKIFKNNAGKKEEKIAPMLKVETLKKISSIAWPLEEIRDKNNKFIGYAMRKAPKGSCTLQDFFIRKLYKLDPLAIIDFLVQLLDALRNIHMSGFIIADFNPKNYMVTSDGEVFICDVDNYQFITKSHKRFNPEVACSEYMAKSLQACLAKYKKTCDFPDSSFNLKTDAVGVGILAFQLLMNGIHPYQGFGTEQVCIEYNILHDYSPYFDRGNKADIKENMPSIDVLTPGLRNLFERVFFGGDMDAIEFEAKLIEELKRYANSLTNSCNGRSKHHYLPTLQECPWCRLEKIKDRLEMEHQYRKKKQESGNQSVISSASTPVRFNTCSSNNNNHKTSGMQNQKTVVQTIPKQVKTVNSTPPQMVRLNNNAVGGVNRAVSSSNTAKVNTNPSSSHIKKMNPAAMQKQLKKDSTKFAWMVAIFLIVTAIEFYALVSGSLSDYYKSAVGTDSLFIFNGFAPYIHVIAGLVLCWLVSDILYNTEFSTPTTILLDIGMQLGIYYMLLMIVGIFTTLASLVFLSACAIGLFGIFMQGL